MAESLRGSIARGATWMLAFRILDRALGFVSTIILARVLVPTDFGLVAMALSVIAMFELVSAFSFEVALIQRTSPGRPDFDTTWTLRLLSCALVALLTIAFALPAAGFFADARIAPVLVALAANIFVGGFENIGVVNFRRDLDFRREFLFMMVKRLTGMPVTLILAVLLNTYWALVAGVIAGNVCSILASYLMHPYRPRFSLEKWRDTLSFSIWMFVFNVLAFLQLRLSHFILGKMHGAEALGIYTISADVASLASNEITAPINRAVMPGLARLNERDGGMQHQLLTIISMVLMITLPAAFGMAAVAEPLVLTMLGQQWQSAVPVLQVLAVAGALQSVTANNQSAYLASGRTHVPVFVSGSFVLALIPLLLSLAPFGVVGVALANLTATVIALMVSVALMKSYLGIPVIGLVRASLRPFLAASMMAVSVYWLDLHRFGMPDDLPAILRLTIGVSVGVFLYASFTLLLWILSGRTTGPERILLERLNALRTRRGTPS